MLKNPWQIVLAAVLTFSTSAICHAADAFGPWPDGTDPAVMGGRLIDNLLARGPATKPYGYPESCSAYGALRLAGATKDQKRLDALVARYAVILGEGGRKLMPTSRPNEDASIEGIIPFELYRQTGNKDYIARGKSIADNQWAAPRKGDKLSDDQKTWVSQGLSKQTRFWIDDMFMITSLQLEAYRCTGDKTYLDHAAIEMVAYIDKLQQPDGLFWHRADAPIHWGRGNGWVAAGMAELLADLPADHPQRAKILKAYQDMMAALVKNQDSDGMWNEVIDDPKAWPESSCTEMFVFAIAQGYRNGWLTDRQYRDAATKGWIGLCKYIDDKANVEQVCVGTNPGTDEQHYLDRGRETGNLHGQAAALWAAWALLPEQPKAPYP